MGPLQGDEDAHLPKDLNLNLSEETLHGIIIKDNNINDNDEDEKTTASESGIVVVAGGGGSLSASTCGRIVCGLWTCHCTSMAAMIARRLLPTRSGPRKESYVPPSLAHTFSFLLSLGPTIVVPSRLMMVDKLVNDDLVQIILLVAIPFHAMPACLSALAVRMIYYHVFHFGT